MRSTPNGILRMRASGEVSLGTLMEKKPSKDGLEFNSCTRARMKGGVQMNRVRVHSVLGSREKEKRGGGGGCGALCVCL